LPASEVRHVVHPRFESFNCDSNIRTLTQPMVLHCNRRFTKRQLL
jgi:hypothetical protein